MDLPGIVHRAGGALLGTLQHVRIPGVGQASVTDDPATSARRWRAVTVLRDQAAVGTPEAPPPPLDRFGDRIEVRLTAAPADRGTELAARFRGTPSEAEIGELRAALREAKQLLEVGEVLRVDPQPHGQRKPTPQGAALEGMTEQAPKEGVL
ncbi:hypothetical protein [Blastococcus xanthinilyticus]|uniref:Uncharacterized protein n=1 Tax=Blastococcus xanthinilyticus TaxID=1564164 RepID=A0A5S5CXT8_9ACTN|nr:hypothetical protein [Blastococcus xanthinilyticus]TYP87838.1 hypothetical protein BD833_1058 [Blastococcus xanthinilyticus]